MHDLSQIIARNLKRIRTEQKLSLDKVADITKVSKSMLGQIERGESNPTINTIWRIAAGLKVSFTALVNLPQEEIVIVRKAGLEALSGDNGRYRVYPVFPYADGRSFELYLVELEPAGCYHSTEPHSEGTKEFVTVVNGLLTLLTNDTKYELTAGDSIAFRADRPHAYQNPGSELTRLSMVIDYQVMDKR